MDGKNYYDDSEVLKKLGIGEATLRKYLRGEIPEGTFDIRNVSFIVIGGRRRWNKEAIDQIDAGLQPRPAAKY